MSQLSLNPKEVVEHVQEIGKEKVDKSFKKHVLKGTMAGMFISFGAIAFTNILANTSDPGLGLFLAAAIFPVGIMAILLLGFELVTSNTLAAVGAYNKKYKFSKVLKMLLIVWFANLIGTLIIAFIAKGANTFTPEMAAVMNTIGEAKANMSFVEMFLRGILCNMLVCAGVMMSLTAKDNISKMAAIWLPIVVFILIRAEHIVANMFFLPMAYLTGANITITEIIYNFLFVSLGNFVGGAVIISGASYLSQLKE